MTQRVYIKIQISKLAGEHLAHSYHYHKEFGVVSLRPFNIYQDR